MSWRDHEYDHGTYMPRRCRRPDEAADAIQKHLAAVERERDQAREALKTIAEHPVNVVEAALDAYRMQNVAREALS